MEGTGRSRAWKHLFCLAGWRMIPCSPWRPSGLPWAARLSADGTAGRIRKPLYAEAEGLSSSLRAHPFCFSKPSLPAASGHFALQLCKTAESLEVVRARGVMAFTSGETCGLRFRPFARRHFWQYRGAKSPASAAMHSSGGRLRRWQIFLLFILTRCQRWRKIYLLTRCQNGRKASAYPSAQRLCLPRQRRADEMKG